MASFRRRAGAVLRGRKPSRSLDRESGLGLWWRARERLSGAATYRRASPRAVPGWIQQRLAGVAASDSRARGGGRIQTRDAFDRTGQWRTVPEDARSTRRATAGTAAGCPHAVGSFVPTAERAPRKCGDNRGRSAAAVPSGPRCRPRPRHPARRPRALRQAWSVVGCLRRRRERSVFLGSSRSQPGCPRNDSSRRLRWEPHPVRLALASRAGLAASQSDRCGGEAGSCASAAPARASVVRARVTARSRRRGGKSQQPTAQADGRYGGATIARVVVAHGSERSGSVPRLAFASRPVVRCVPATRILAAMAVAPRRTGCSNRRRVVGSPTHSSSSYMAATFSSWRTSSNPDARPVISWVEIGRRERGAIPRPRALVRPPRLVSVPLRVGRRGVHDSGYDRA